MRRLVNLFILLLSSSTVLSQTEFKGDSIYSESIRVNRINQVIDSSFNLDANSDFEFRLWTLPSLSDYATLFVLMQRHGKWTARYFEYRGNGESVVKESNVDPGKLDSLWNRLVANQVLTLPTHDSIRNKMKIFIADTSYVLEEDDMYKRVMMTDGAIYRFELKDRNKRRAYEYHCPMGYLKHYPNLEELYRAFSIIVLVRKYLGLSLKIC